MFVMIDEQKKSRKTDRRTDQSLSAHVCFAMYSTLLGINRVYRDLLLELDLTYPQYLVMLVLWERDGVNVSHICSQLFLETTTLTPLLKRLERRGLLHRRRSEDDERQVIVRLTAEGQALRAKAQHLPGCVAEAMGQSPDELNELRLQLETIRNRLFRKA